MTRTHTAAMVACLLIAPAAAASPFFSSSAKPCFSAGNATYQLTGRTAASVTVRIDNATATPSLRIQIVDDASAADFVMVDDNDVRDACAAAATIRRIHLDPAATKADLVVALSRAPADYRIFVRSTAFTEQDAAALFAVILQDSRTAAARRNAGQATGQAASSSRDFAAQN